MSLPRFDLENAIGELRAAKAAKVAKGEDARQPPPPQEVQTLATLATLAEGVAEIAFWFEARAALREHDGGISRAEAERGALQDCVARWRAQSPLPASDDKACAFCGRSGPCTPVLALGGHAWLHRACWAPMNAQREALAREAVLAALRQAAAASLTGADISALKDANHVTDSG